MATNNSSTSNVAVSEAAAADAETLKNQANEQFKNLHYDKAIELYSQAIDMNPTIPAYYTNRSFAYIKTESFGYALDDANKALELDKAFVKAYYRRATAYMALSKWKEGLKDLRTVCKVVPNDKDAKNKLDACEKIVRRIDFEKAIDSSQDKKNPFDTLDFSSVVVDSSYDGHRLDDDGKITLEFVKDVMDRFKNQKTIHKRYIFQILQQAYKYFRELPSLIDIPVPEGAKFTVCGDTHGQYYDVLNIFELNGLPSESNGYLFNGDFVDRGSFSAEVVITFLCFKLLYPQHFFMTRGNHESDDMNKIYGFQGEIKHKYSDMVFQLFREVFNSLPLAACLESKVLVLHGGLFSSDSVTLDDIRKIDRFRQPGSDDIMTELLWSDPQTSLGRGMSKRGIGIHFGPDVTKNFLERNNLELLIRSHEVQDNGYQVHHNGQCITVFSAPNYCDQVGNKGAYIVFHHDMKPDFQTFSCVPHPAVKPMAYASNYGMMGF